MLMLLSGAWWAQRLGGVVTQAFALALIVALIGGGLMWLRHDARMDERAAWTGRVASARLQAMTAAKVRQDRSEAIGAEAARKREGELADSEAARTRAETLLAKLKGRVVCWPKEIVPDLNR
jgi:hypothetical protein